MHTEAKGSNDLGWSGCLSEIRAGATRGFSIAAMNRDVGMYMTFE